MSESECPCVFCHDYPEWPPNGDGVPVRLKPERNTFVTVEWVRREALRQLQHTLKMMEFFNERRTITYQHRQD